MMRKLFACIALLILCLQATAQLTEYGLHIQTYPLPSGEHTGIALEGGKPIETKGETLGLEFQLQVRPENIFGCIVRIITDCGRNIDLMYSVGDQDLRLPILVVGDKVYPIASNVTPGVWIQAKISIDPQSGNISAYYDDAHVNANDPALKGAQSFRIAFGRCPFAEFTLLDVASINLKEVSVRKGKQEIRHWKMARHNDSTCFDEQTHAPATGENANWIIDRHITWTKIHTQRFAAPPSVTFDPTIATFYAATDGQKLYVFHATERSTDTLQVQGGEYVANYPNQLIYIPQRRELLSYNLDENLFSAFDPNTQQWRGTQPPTQEHDYWNNTLSFNPEDSSLVSFGGYGHYHYNNKLLVCYPYAANRPPTEVVLKEIHPRCSTTSTVVDNVLYLFGGRGCPSGRQELSPRDYYDFYAVDLNNYQVKKLWEWQTNDAPDGGHFQPGDNMIYDPKRACFYFLCMQQGIVLMKMNAGKPGFEAMTLPIEIEPAQYYYKSLYYSPLQKKLYAAIVQSKVNGQTDLDIYELDFPPITVASFQQTEVTDLAKANHLKKSYSLTFILLIGALVAGTAIFVSIRRRRHPAPTELPAEQPAETTEQHSPSVPDVPLQEPETLPAPEEQPAQEEASAPYDLSHSCIRFFGGFRVIDRNGEDITPLFTPILKSLLLLLILHTGKDERGINGSKMIQYLWFDKMEESAKNNRNVSITKLRNLLKQVGDISIIKYGNFWSIRFGKDSVCDYLEAIQLYKNYQTEGLDRLLALLLQGSMLPNVENEWVDVFKNDFANRTIDLLTQQLNREKLSDALRLKIADTLFLHDYISEEALQAKCRIFYRQGKKGLAKTVYNSFCKEYSALMGTTYDRTLAEIIQEENSSPEGAPK